MSRMTSTTTLVTGSVDSVAANLKAEEAAAQNPKPRRLTQYIAAVSATLGAFALGNVIGWSSPASGRLQGDTSEVDFDVSASEFAWVGSLLTIGAAASTFPAGILVERVGRKQTMFWTALPFIFGWALILFASGVEMLYAGRLITGFCGGVFSVACNLYVGEIAEKEIRGALGTLFQLMVVVGIEFVFVLGAFISLTALNAVCLSVPVIFGFLFFWMPETPQFHLKMKRREEAHRALQWFRGGADCEFELREMQQNSESQRSVPVTRMLDTLAARRALMVSIGLMACQQLSGINAVVFYTEDLFKAAGSSLESRYSVIVVGAVQLVATVAALLVIDRLGRRLLMSASQAAMAACTLFLGVYLYFREVDELSVSGLGWLPILLICIYFVAFSLGAGPIPWLMLGELFPAEIKGSASALSACINWLIAFLVTRFYGDLVSWLNGSSTFWIFTILLLAGLAFVHFFVPETRGKSLDDIQDILASKNSAHNNLTQFSPNSIALSKKEQHHTVDMQQRF
ncbi:facilitated trehalose transporter Tret1-like isoform X2 [Neocloeon triangulifer]|nr:facilitated trehalose transporter Tret1-like isoform X2 [Neocloeon triangulifer]